MENDDNVLFLPRFEIMYTPIEEEEERKIIVTIEEDDREFPEFYNKEIKNELNRKLH